MTLAVTSVGPSFDAEVTGVDFSRPLGADTVAEIVAAMDRYAVCVFRGTALSDESHIAFSRQLGKLEHAPRLFYRLQREGLPATAARTVSITPRAPQATGSVTR